jgi:hypothetical protein
MRRFGSHLSALLLSLVVTGCEGFVVLISTGPLPPPVPSPTGPNPPPPRPLVVGEVVHSTFAGPVVTYDLAAPSTGTIFVRLSWNRSHGPIQLAVAGSVFTQPAGTSTGSTDVTIVAKTSVRSGEHYTVTVDDGSDVAEKAPVDFTLSASMN